MKIGSWNMSYWLNYDRPNKILKMFLKKSEIFVQIVGVGTGAAVVVVVITALQTSGSM
jgi:hypothetical protein